MRDCPSRRVKGGSNGTTLFTTSPAPSSRFTKKDNSFGTAGGQRQNRFHARQDHKGYLEVVTGTLRVFDLDVYALLDLGATLYFVTPCIAFQFSVSP